MKEKIKIPKGKKIPITVSIDYAIRSTKNEINEGRGKNFGILEGLNNYESLILLEKMKKKDEKYIH